MPVKELNEVEQNPTLPGLKKMNRHVTIAMNHLNKRRSTLIVQRSKLTTEIDEIDQALLALE